MNAFIRRNLDPATRLGEILFGLIMALGFTASVRLGRAEADNREMFIGILGCNVAWAIVDAVMYVLTELFERGRRARLVTSVLAARTDDDALRQISDALDDRLAEITTAEDRERVHRAVLDLVRKGKPVPATVHRADLVGGAAVGLIILLATFPVLVPFLVVQDAELAVRLSNTVAIAELCLLGARWASFVGANPWRIASGLTLLGMMLVVITILLGG